MSDLSQRDRACLLGVLSSCLLLGLPTLSAAEHAPKADSLKVEIDNRIEAGWKGQGVTPAAITSDSEFLRRVSLDLVGRIPTIAEVRGFLADDKPQKRERLVDRLLSSPEFAHHAATILRRMWIPQTDTQEFKRLIFDYESWLARRLRERAPFDELVRQQLCVPVNGMAVPINPDGDEIGSSAFSAVSDMKPEILAANTARAFQGINIDCAQCHDHPFARWTREQFWQTAAFFTRPSTDVAQPNAALTILLTRPAGESSPARIRILHATRSIECGRTFWAPGSLNHWTIFLEQSPPAIPNYSIGLQRLSSKVTSTYGFSYGPSC